MNISYDEGVSLVKQCWADDGVKFSFGKSAALNALRQHLQDNSLQYTHEEALNWLSINQNAWNKNKFFTNRRAVYELHDVMTTGRIVGDYKYYIDPFDTLSEYWQEKVTEYIAYLKTIRSESAVRSQRVHCISFTGFLTETGVKRAEDITCFIISKYHDFAETVGDKYTSIYSVRDFIQFLVDQGLIPRHSPYALTAPVQAKAIGYAIQKYDRVGILAHSTGITPEVFWDRSALLVPYLASIYHYDETALRNNFTTFFQMYYVFCAEKGILCSEENEQLWLSLMSDFWKHSQQEKSALRAFRLLHIFESKGELTLSDIKAHNTNKGSITRLDEYFRNILDEFLTHRKLENVSASTIELHRSAGLSFFLYLQSKEFKNVVEVDFMEVKQYCIWISGQSSNKLNNYAYSLRILLQYLFEKEYTIFDLSKALPMQSVQVRKIVEVLSEEEVERIYKYRENASTPLEYRDSAILMLGLLMGLRRIDIVNLRKSDIDWKNRTISITQQKTYRPLVLPMPIPVGNSIHLYNKYGRSNSDLDDIFLSTAAPYGKAHTSACGKAMSRVLPERGTGFHILRRTFASRLLLAGTDTTKIKDSLGHSTMNTVHRYLSVDEESLRACCLPLERTVVKIEATA